MLLDTQPYKVPAVEQPLEPWRQLLLDAADRIERAGWWNGKSIQQNHHCIETALHNPLAIGRGQAMAAVANYVGGKPYVWNDAPGRTKEEVLAAMRGAARS